MEFVKDIVINDKYHFHARIHNQKIYDQYIKISFYDKYEYGNTHECFTTHFLEEECVNEEGVYDPKIVMIKAANIYVKQIETKEREEHAMKNFELWNGVINIEE